MKEQNPQPAPEGEANQPRIDPMLLQMHMQRIRDEQNLGMGIVAGSLAAIVGGALWATITYLTDWQIGFMAIGVGFLVGWSIRKVGRGVDKIFGVLGAVLSMIGCLLGNYFTICVMIAEEYQVDFFDVLGNVELNDAAEMIMETSGPIDILFYGLALYYGFQYSLRKVTAEELTAPARPV